MFKPPPRTLQFKPLLDPAPPYPKLKLKHHIPYQSNNNKQTNFKPLKPNKNNQKTNQNNQKTHRIQIQAKSIRTTTTKMNRGMITASSRHLSKGRQAQAGSGNSKPKKKVGKYELFKILGQGQFGAVYIARDTEDNYKPYAIKQVQKIRVNKSPLLKRLFKTELEVMRMIKHPNLLHLYDFMETSKNYYLVTQYCEDGDLKQYVRKKQTLTEQEAVYFLKQIMSGFMELHSKKIMHRDFKLANIFLHKGKVVIGDFGFAKAGADMAVTKLGTPYNMAPEILFSEGKTPYTNLMDVWSIGVVFYQMLFGGEVPFKAWNVDELKKLVRRKSGKNLVFPSHPPVSQQAKDLLTRMLECNIKKRLNWPEFFNHPIFENVVHSAFMPDYPTDGNTNLANSTVSLQHQERNVNEDDLTPQQRQNQVNWIFESDKKRANLMSDVMILPYPTDLDANMREDAFHNIPFKRAKSIQNAQEIKNQSVFNYQNNYFCHERNKSLLIFQTAKRARQLTKHPKFEAKHNYLYTICLGLLRKGLVLLENTIHVLKRKINIYKLPDFEEYCASPVGLDTVGLLEKDCGVFRDYFSHIHKMIEQRKTGFVEEASINSDHHHMTAVGPPGGPGHGFHAYLRRLKTNTTTSSKGDLTEQRTQPESLAQHGPPQSAQLPGQAPQKAMVKVDSRFDDKLISCIMSKNPQLPVIDDAVEKLLVNLVHHYRSESARMRPRTQKELLLFLNYCHYVLDLDRFFPFFSADLKDYNKDLRRYYSVRKGQKAYEQVNSGDGSDGFSQRSKKRFSSGMDQRYLKEEVFNWSEYFKYVEGSTNLQLYEPLGKYVERDDVLGKFD